MRVCMQKISATVSSSYIVVRLVAEPHSTYGVQLYQPIHTEVYTKTYLPCQIINDITYRITYIVLHVAQYPLSLMPLIICTASRDGRCLSGQLLVLLLLISGHFLPLHRSYFISLAQIFDSLTIYIVEKVHHKSNQNTT